MSVKVTLKPSVGKMWLAKARVKINLDVINRRRRRAKVMYHQSSVRHQSVEIEEKSGGTSVSSCRDSQVVILIDY